MSTSGATLDRKTALRDTYAHKALQQIPRILSNQDRTPTSPTYGLLAPRLLVG